MPSPAAAAATAASYELQLLGSAELANRCGSSQRMRFGPMTGAPGQPPDYPLRSRAQWRQRRRRVGEVASQYGRLETLVVALVHRRVQQKGRWVSVNIHPPVVTTGSRRPDRDPLPAPAALPGPTLLLRQVWPLPVPVAQQS